MQSLIHLPHEHSNRASEDIARSGELDIQLFEYCHVCSRRHKADGKLICKGQPNGPLREPGITPIGLVIDAQWQH